ncbi:GNAT family N-acetyltransferase [Luteimonas fraxinea]|uniref:GNAT family N-acetyltransferase n=1 Tax=Luteimonas fraxinea TaxID=2901869 RepID=UPI001E457C96|nr:GNAT family protein [Luteimonas fraxinea]MCD9126746.1 GNAT family N-acetyltransferase [Luteimonas fraxinea]
MTADTASEALPQGWPAGFEIAGVRATLLSDGDADLFVALYGDPGTMRHVAPVLDHHAATRAFAAARRQMQAAPPVARYWCLDTASGARGLLSLVADADGRAAETGLLLPPTMQAQGVATTALGHLRDAVLRAGAFDALWTRHRVGHAAAIGLMRRLGFMPEAPADGWQRWRLDRRTWRALVDAPPAD